eukprot:TRINITY_DN3249_c0_g2_i1.p1 TRINITY_DN3249_c0_g2~~TRINITY_DN3249_c0_g2_i1.p1  ORF type:complete len:152 (-),score=8.00 TRINITY_DN3249_c0_g2_i1:31-486(-)
MNKLNFLLFSTVACLAVSMIPHHFLKPIEHTKTDCSKYSQPSLDENGKPFQSFASFYPYYVCEHLKPGTKLFHFVGTGNLILLMTYTVISGQSLAASIVFGTIQAYGFAWFSHFMIEQNKPATFNYPFFSFLGDFKMFSEGLQGEYVLWQN